MSLYYAYNNSNLYAFELRIVLLQHETTTFIILVRSLNSVQRQLTYFHINFY